MTTDNQDDPIQGDLHATMNALASFLHNAVAPHAFALLVFDHDTGRANYISNAKREEMIAAMKDFLGRQPKGN